MIFVVLPAILLSQASTSTSSSSTTSTTFFAKPSSTSTWVGDKKVRLSLSPPPPLKRYTAHARALSAQVKSKYPACLCDSFLNGLDKAASGTHGCMMWQAPNPGATNKNMPIGDGVGAPAEMGDSAQITCKATDLNLKNGAEEEYEEVRDPHPHPYPHPRPRPHPSPCSPPHPLTPPRPLAPSPPHPHPHPPGLARQLRV